MRVKDPRVDSGSVYAAVYRPSLTHFNGAPGRRVKLDSPLRYMFAKRAFIFFFFKPAYLSSVCEMERKIEEGELEGRGWLR